MLSKILVDKPLSATPSSEEATTPLKGVNLNPRSGHNNTLNDLRRFGPSLLALASPTPALTAEDFAKYKSRTFTVTLDGKTKVQPNGMKIEDTKKSVNSVTRKQYKDHDFENDFDVVSVSDAKYNGRLVKNGQFYPYFNHQNKTEGPGAVALWSINGAKVQGFAVPGGKPELAEELNRIEKKYGKTIIGFRPLDFEQGWFALIYKDKGGTIKMGQFALDGFNTNGNVDPERMKKIFHATISSIAEHYLSKP